MKVKEVLNDLMPGTKYQLMGSKTGKILFQSWRQKTKEQFLELDASLIGASVRIQNDYIFKYPEWIEPIVIITIVGK